ncbi:hypothetical protein D0859_17181 [Hortaea werneckii]|uniref:Uncharacterized protein n=1 Tax=Hortaea werneckii TaxID=91943 RepID=A0A3M7I0G8_HORWE|nr:hypothetical protein D0859_17181 [Hortaea werneckii]
MPRAPSARSPTVPSPNAGATTAVATSSSSVGCPSTITGTSTSTGTGNQPPTRTSESYHSFAQREEAARILQSYEKLSWYSYARCEVCPLSVPPSLLSFFFFVFLFTKPRIDLIFIPSALFIRLSLFLIVLF